MSINFQHISTLWAKLSQTHTCPCTGQTHLRTKEQGSRVLARFQLGTMCSPTGQVCLPFLDHRTDSFQQRIRLFATPALQLPSSPALRLSVLVMVRLGETNQQINTLSKFVSRMRMPFATAGAHCVSFPFSARPRAKAKAARPAAADVDCSKVCLSISKMVFVKWAPHPLLPPPPSALTIHPLCHPHMLHPSVGPLDLHSSAGAARPDRTAWIVGSMCVLQMAQVALSNSPGKRRLRLTHRPAALIPGRRLFYSEKSSELVNLGEG